MLREGVKEAELELQAAERELTEARVRQARAEACTRAAVDEVDFRLSVALVEATRWADYTFQAMQLIQQRSNHEISFQHINQTFPYLQDADCSLLLGEQEEEEEEAEDDGWSTPIERILASELTPERGLPLSAIPEEQSV